MNIIEKIAAEFNVKVSQVENTVKLKPCKFCGGLGKIRTVPFDSEDYELFRKYSDIEHDDCSFVVECSHCGATIDPIYPLENAVKVWNSGEARLVNDKP